MEHKYKVGDLVRILPRIGSSLQYRFSYADEMLPFEGQILKIEGMSDARYTKGLYVKDDCKCYHLEGNDFNWASSMFEPYEEGKINSSKFKEGDIVEILPREGESDDYSHAYVPDMLEYAGKRATIVRVRKDSTLGKIGRNRRDDDGYGYTLDIDRGTWLWSSSALIAVSSKEPDKKNIASVEVTPIKSDQLGRPEYPYSLIRESQENYNLNFNM